MGRLVCHFIGNEGLELGVEFGQLDQVEISQAIIDVNYTLLFYDFFEYIFVVSQLLLNRSVRGAQI